MPAKKSQAAGRNLKIFPPAGGGLHECFGVMCSPQPTCVNQDPFLFSVLREKRNGSWTPKRKGRQRDELLYSSMARHRDRRTSYSSGATSMARQNTPSRVQERGKVPVRRSMERQRTAGFQATPHCYSGDPGFSLGFPFFARSPEDTSSGRLSLECKNRFFPREERNGS